MTPLEIEILKQAQEILDLRSKLRKAMQNQSFSELDELKKAYHLLNNPATMDQGKQIILNIINKYSYNHQY